tara:strand:+ start:953 stop:1096 length:144 start_codon:yes stop_codon:yes gene_type:complete
MNKPIDVEAQVIAILDIVNDNYYQAMKLVCDDIQIKSQKDLNTLSSR